MNRPAAAAAAIATLMSLTTLPSPAREPLEISIFTPPAGEAAPPETVERRGENPLDRTLTNVRSASLTITWPRDMSGSRPAVLILPGGGYGKLVIDKEGHAIAQWLNDHGFVAAVLKYRLPRSEMYSEKTPWPIQDATSAMHLLRSRAKDFSIDPKLVGILGSSAGGHLAATLATHDFPGSARPDFQILLYPVITFRDESIIHAGSRRNLLGPRATTADFVFYSNESQVDPETPPAFVVHAIDDGIVNVEHSRRYAEALRRAGVPSEYLEIATGGHGFGLGVNGGEPLRWPPLCLAWLKRVTGEED